MSDYLRPETDMCLDQVILSIRSKRPHVGKSLPYTVYKSGRYIQLWVNTSACKFSLTGKCSICDYWDGEFTKNAIQRASEYIDNIGDACDTLLLNTCGSCLCDEELPFEQLMNLVSAIAKTTVKRVILESHLAYATKEKLTSIVNVLNGKEVVLEYGQESTSPYVLQYCLNKPSMLHEFDIIPTLQWRGVTIIANIVIGSPFLTVYNRINDAVDSIQTLLQKGIDEVVLFPVNIKPYTLVKYLYDNGYYKRVNANEIIKALCRFSSEELGRIDIAWFEPQREELPAYSEQGLGPQYCEKCGEIIFEHLLKYRDANNGTERKEILQEAEMRMCDCEDYLYNYPFPEIDEAYRFISETVLRRV
jgi:radical SAM enzyme (TIGR01210 family)